MTLSIIVLVLLCLVSFVLNVIYVECCKYALCAECHYAECHYAECHYAECHYAECRYAECRGALLFIFSTLPLSYSGFPYTKRCNLTNLT
jgi:hypothetical protein